MSEVAAFLPFAESLADAAGEILRRHYRSAFTVEDKADLSPVTIADREAERVMRDAIRRAHPDHGIAGEELGGEGTDRSYVWCLDPIDGTKNFVAGRPQFGTLIALTRDGAPVLGVIAQPILNERWLGVEDRPSLFDGKPIRTRACKDIGRAILSTSSPYLFAAGFERDAFERLRERVRFPVFGGDCYAYGLLALGFVDIVVEAGLKPYDYAALVPVIEGAGGRITDWRGRRPTLASDGRVLAAGDADLHAQALAILSGA